MVRFERVPQRPRDWTRRTVGETTVGEDALQISIDREGEHPVLILAGELDIDGVPKLRDCAVQLIGEGPPSRIILDMRNLDFIDSTGIGLLAGILKRIRHEGGEELVVRAPSHRVLRVIELTGMQKALIIEP